MLTGKKVKLNTTLRMNHPAVRFDSGQGTAGSVMIPAGSQGTIDISSTSEILVSIYQNPSNMAGFGFLDKVWIKREYFGQFFTIV
jgi:hypothetical protein